MLKTLTMRVVLSLLLASATQFAAATPGKVDINGCHNSKKIGWHCHPERAGQYRELPAARETAIQRDKRLARECRGLQNAGACLGYSR